MVFHGNGGYDFITVYNLPIWLRKFIYKSMEEHYEKMNEGNEKTLENTVNNKPQSPSVARPNISPQNTYVTKAPKK